MAKQRPSPQARPTGGITRQHNASLRSMLRTAVKKVRKAIAAGDKAAAAASSRRRRR